MKERAMRIIVWRREMGDYYIYMYVCVYEVLTTVFRGSIIHNVDNLYGFCLDFHLHRF